MFDLENINLKKEIADSEKINCWERGGVVNLLINYIQKKESPAGIEKVKITLKKAGYHLPNLKEIDDLDWVPCRLQVVLLAASTKVFHWQKKDLINLGRRAFSYHLSMRKFFMKFFLSLEKTLNMAVQVWPKYYSEGHIKIIKHNKKEHFIVIHLIDFKKHPLTCLILQGIFMNIVKLASGSKKVTVRETKCVFRGDPYHEYVIKY